MRRALILTCCLVALTRCAFRRPVDERVAIELKDDGQHARVVVDTKLDDRELPPRATARVAAAREALVAGRDAWSVRFDRIQPSDERLVIDKAAGVVNHVEHAATLNRDDLQRLLADANVTVQLTHGDGFSELTIYPAASTRATRAEREHLARLMDAGSKLLAEYFDALQHFYTYVDAHPQRGEMLFAAIYEEDVIVTDEEAALIQSIRTPMNALMELQSDSDVYTITDEADLVYNPFPADITFRLPSAPTAVAGFARKGDTSVAIARTTILDALLALEHRWASPNPLAMTIRAYDTEKEPPTPAEMAAMPRHASAGVTAAEIRAAIVERLAPAEVYRVRWSE